jgi:hypothetical protein
VSLPRPRKGRAGVGLRILLPIVLLLIALPLDQTHAAPLGQWTSTTSYPNQIAGESCVVYSDQAYCVGGFNSKGGDYNSVYRAPLTSTGIGAWSATSPYPAKIDSASCAVSGSEVYCVGGENSTDVLSNVYAAPISSSGVGGWSGVAAYPQTIAASSCVVNAGYIYCIGGYDINGEETSSVYYSSLASGLSSWVSTTPYPVAVDAAGCVVEANDVYCVAGQEESGLPNFPIPDVYYAQLSANGVGTWYQTTPYPIALASPSCVQSSGNIYCVGGYDLSLLSHANAYVGAISSSGAVSWANATSYPVPVDVNSCVSDFSNMYCIAGRQSIQSGVSVMGSDYYAPLLAPGTAPGPTPPPVSTTTTTTTSTTSTTTSTPSITTSTTPSTTSTTPTTTSTPTSTTVATTSTTSSATTPATTTLTGTGTAQTTTSASPTSPQTASTYTYSIPANGAEPQPSGSSDMLMAAALVAVVGVVVGATYLARRHAR